VDEILPVHDTLPVVNELRQRLLGEYDASDIIELTRAKITYPGRSSGAADAAASASFCA
jgi:hypothetical protein